MLDLFVFWRKRDGQSTPRRLASAIFSNVDEIVIPESKHKVRLGHFDLLKVLGRGNYGKVMLVRKKDTNEIFAMKALHKEAIIARNQIQHTKTERNVLQVIDHPNIVKLHYAFQNEGQNIWGFFGFFSLFLSRFLSSICLRKHVQLTVISEHLVCAVFLEPFLQ
jgi:serine/threonine protein kinase